MTHSLLVFRTAFLVWSALLLSAPTNSAGAVVQFPVSACTVTEGIGRLDIPVQRQEDSNAVVSVGVATVPVTATPGVDYTELATNVIFRAGETSRTVCISILKHSRVGSAKSFRVLLHEPTGGANLGSKTNLTVTILNGNKGIHLYVPALSVNEDAGRAVIQVARGDDGDTRMTVDCATADGTALAGQDYTPVSKTIAFEPGEVLGSLEVPLVNDTRAEANKTFSVTLSNPTGGGVLGSPQTMKVTITDTDRTLQLNSPRYFVREGAEFVQVGITQGENDAPASVDLTTTDGSATAGLDYVGLTNKIHFDPGERLKLVQIRILNDGVKESEKSFAVTLSNPTGGAVLGKQQTANVAITDDAPGVGFTTNSFCVASSAGVANACVRRGNGAPMSAFAVRFQTVNGSALEGVHYQAASGTLNFESNQTLQTITIPLLHSSATKGRTSFKVTLTNPPDGISLGTATATVSICNPGGYYPILPPIDAKPKVQLQAGVVLVSWEGDGALQRADRVSGLWEDLPGGKSPYAVQPSLCTSFYRIQSTRPTEVYVPASSDGRTPLPLILALHPLNRDAAWMRGWLPLETLAESKGFLVCYPNGTVDPTGLRFWNGPDFLSFSNPDMDDAGYLRGIIEEIQRRFAVDPKRIYVTGASSGGAMSHRLALEHADLIAGIASVSGRTYYDPNACHPAHPVNVLQIDGSADFYLGWTGPDYGMPYVAEAPGAVRTVQNWARLNGCQDPVVEAVPSFNGTTTVLRYIHCPPGGAVELWTVNGAGHGPSLSPAWLVDWLLAHPKP